MTHASIRTRHRPIRISHSAQTHLRFLGQLLWMTSSRSAAAAIAATVFLASGSLAQAQEAQWIWRPDIPGNIENEFSYFRRSFELQHAAPNAAVWLAADSQAALFVNGHLVARKVTRFTVKNVRPEKVQIGAWLHEGTNNLVVRHHNWGSIKNFQRERVRTAGLWVERVAGTGLPDIATDARWSASHAPEFITHHQQIVGVTGDLRIRFPVIEDGRKRQELATLRSEKAVVINKPIWTVKLDADQATPQREFFVPAQRVIGAGEVLIAAKDWNETANLAVADQLDKATYRSDLAFEKSLSPLVLGQSVTVNGHSGETRYVSVDFDEPIHGYPTLTAATSIGGASLSLVYGEVALSAINAEAWVDPKTGALRTKKIVGDFLFDRYFTAGSGVEQVELPDERTARYMLVAIHFPIAGSVTLSHLGIVSSQFPIDWKGSFESGDAQLQQIITLAKEHSRVSASDAYVDTPGREDGAWLEDIQARALLNDTWTGASSEARRRVLLLAEESRLGDGKFLAFAPQSFLDVTPWDWGMRWIIMLRDEWRWSGDRAFLKERSGALRKYVSLLLANVDGDGLFRTSQVLGDLRVGLHPKTDRDVSAIGQANLVLTLAAAVEVAEAVGEKSLVREWTARAADLRAGFRRTLIDHQGGVAVSDYFDAELRRSVGRSQAAQLAALDADLLTPTEAASIIERFFPDPFGLAPTGVAPWNNPTYSERVVTQLTRFGFGSRALAHLRRRYAPYLPGSPLNPVDLKLQGPNGGPLPEYLVTAQEVGTAVTTQPIDPTGSHGWAAVPLLWLHQSVLGVTWGFNEAGTAGGRIKIKPNDCGLPFINGHVETPLGDVWVAWDPSLSRLTVDVPAGATASIVAPGAGRWQLEAPKQAKVQRLTPSEFEVTGPGTYLLHL